MNEHILERFESCTMSMDDDFYDYEVPAYLYGDWAVHANIHDDNGWCIMLLVGSVKFPYVFNTALEAAQWTSMLNGIGVDWSDLDRGALVRIAEVLTPLYLERYREYTYVNAA